MEILVLQLAKMTIVVLGILFTPMITRKLVQDLKIPAAQEMMKWGMGGAALAFKGAGLAKGLVSTVAQSAAGKSAGTILRTELGGIAKAASRGGQSMLSEMESVRHPAVAAAGSVLKKGLKSVNEWSDRSRLKEEAEREGIFRPTALERKQASKSSAGREALFKKDQQFENFVREKRGVVSAATGLSLYSESAPRSALVSAGKLAQGAVQKAVHLSKEISRRSETPSLRASTPGASSSSSPNISSDRGGIGSLKERSAPPRSSFQRTEERPKAATKTEGPSRRSEPRVEQARSRSLESLKSILERHGKKK